MAAENISGYKISKDSFKRVGIDESDSERLDKPSLTYWADVWRRFKENKFAMVGLILLTFMIFIVIAGPSLSGQDYQYIDYSIKEQGPSAQHWFGTDDMGRDIFTRVCYGGRISIAIGLICTVIMFFLGSFIGALAGLKGGWIDNIIMRFIEVIGNLPYLIIIIILTMVLGRSIFSLIFAMSILSWVGTARMVRGQILQLKEQEYIEAAEALGAGTGRIIVRHLCQIL